MEAEKYVARMASKFIIRWCNNDTADKLADLAKTQRMSLNSYINVVLENHIYKSKSWNPVIGMAVVFEGKPFVIQALNLSTKPYSAHLEHPIHHPEHPVQPLNVRLDRLKPFMVETA